jgi:hypothetical protein
MAGAAGAAGPNGRSAHDDARGHRRLAWITLMFAGGLVVSALLVSARTHGWQGALMDLAQMRTRDDLVAYGSHWRFHWLSTLWFGVTAALVVPAFLGRPASAPRSIDGRVVAAWGFFGALTLLFGVSGEVFTDVRFTGHQAREILTHGLVTGPLAVGIVLMLRGVRHGAGVPGGDVRGAGVIGGLVRTARSRPISAALCVVIPLYLAAVTLAGDPLAVGQSDQGLSAMLAGHVFEHALDYLFVLLLVTGGCALLDGPRGLDRQP